LILAVVGYFVYIGYNNSQATLGYLKESQTHVNAAENYLNQAYAYENKGDYTNAITMLQKSSEELSKALNNDFNALRRADGVYKDYLKNDVLLIKAELRLTNIKLALDYDTIGQKPYNHTQEVDIDYNMLSPIIIKANNDIFTYKNKKNEIIASNPNSFKFLNQTS
jgi:hypothetical protein